MKKKLLLTLLSGSIVLAAMNSFAGKQGGTSATQTGTSVAQSNSGSQTETVQFSAPLDMKSCLIGPVLLQSFASDSSSLSKADAESLVKALASVQAAVAGDVQLSITRHGNNGSVHKAELSGVMQNGQLAFLTTAAEAEGDAEANAYANTSASTNVGASTSTQLNIPLVNRPLA